MMTFDSTLALKGCVVFYSYSIVLEYFAQLGENSEEDECINLEYIDFLLKNGANINCTDKYGQCVLHEVINSTLCLKSDDHRMQWELL